MTTPHLDAPIRPSSNELKLACALCVILVTVAYMVVVLGTKFVPGFTPEMAVFFTLGGLGFMLMGQIYSVQLNKVDFKFAMITEGLIGLALMAYSVEIVTLIHHIAQAAQYLPRSS